MKKLLISIFLIFVLYSNAQQIITTYYKDLFLKKEIEEKKANFKRVETKNIGGIINIKIYDIKKNCLMSDLNYKKDKPVGVWNTYSKDCDLISTIDFSKLVYSNIQIDSLFNNKIEKDNTNKYELAQYGENEDALFKYIVSIIKYPIEALENDISGKVYLQFIIKADGSIKMFSILQGVHPFLDIASWELIENMPKWNPAKKNGQPIDSYFSLPISFELN